MHGRVFGTLTLALLVAVAVRRDGRIVLVEDERPRSSIVVGKGAALIAAQELQTYIEKISGARLPIGNADQATRKFRGFSHVSPMVRMGSSI